MAERLELEQILRDDDNVIEVLPTDLEFVRRRVQVGMRYLGLVEPSEYARLVGAEPELASLIAPLTSLDQVMRNNADVLILNGDVVRLMWTSRIGGPRLIMFPMAGLAGLEGIVARFVARSRSIGTVRWSGRRYLVVEQWTTDDRVARHYASPALGLTGLAGSLADAEIRYAVLRWFEDLPALEPGEDLDMLVDDAHLGELCDLLDGRPGTIPCDVYSVTGLPGADYRSVAYYPPPLAAGLLDRSVVHDSGFVVPSPTDHFRSLAYHALYHKGEMSGMPTSLGGLQPVVDPEHDYARSLADLASADAYGGPITMESIDEHLADVGWRPPHDTLGRLAAHNEWVRLRFFASSGDGGGPTRLAVFILRERASDPDSIVMAQSVLEDWGFDVVMVERLDPSARQRGESAIRGGNWGPGPYPTSGGAPSVVILAVDDHPEAPNREQAAQYPGLTNLNILRAKLTIRDRFLSALADDQQCNAVHSSDGDADAWSYIETIWPQRVTEIRETVEQRLGRDVEAGRRTGGAIPDPLAQATPATPTGRTGRADVVRVVRSARRRVVGSIARRRIASIRIVDPN